MSGSTGLQGRRKPASGRQPVPDAGKPAPQAARNPGLQKGARDAREGKPIAQESTRNAQESVRNGSSIEMPKPPRRSHAERREEAERRILEAAVEVVAAKGSVRMTLAEVGAQAGYSRGLPLHRFGSKSGLLKALATHIVEGFRKERADRHTLSPGLASIRASIEVYFGGRDRKRTSMRALIVMMTEASLEGSDLRETVATYNRSVIRYFERNLRAAIEKGEVASELDPSALAVVLLGAMRGTLLQWLSDDGIRMRKARDALLRIVDRL